MLCPLSCRWRPDWHPCHPSLTIGGIHDRRFHFVLSGQTSGQECVLQRATSIQVRVVAAATVVTYSLEAYQSPPVQRGGKSSESDCLNALIDPEQQHRNPSTRFAGRCVATSVVVADRRSKEPHLRGNHLHPSMLCVTIRLPCATNPHYRWDHSLR